MPTYSYACKQCGHEFDIRQSFSDDPLTVCPQCDGALRKVIHPVGIAFKGSGFYKTDSRAASDKKKSSSTDSKKPAAKSSDSGSTSDTSSAGAPSDTKSAPAAKPASGSSSSTASSTGTATS